MVSCKLELSMYKSREMFNTNRMLFFLEYL